MRRRVPLLLLGLLDAFAASPVLRAPSRVPSRAGVAMTLREPGGELDRHNPVFDRFILQRAVQTQIYYLNELHDQPNARFLGQFGDHEGLDEYHGFDGLNAEPENYISSLLATPPIKVGVSSWSSVRFGGSPGNPHLPKREMKTHDFMVYPDRIGQGLLRCRDQIAKETAADLDVLASCDVDFWRRRETGIAPTLDFGSADGDSSPTRRATFDLISKLTLHVAVKQTLGAMSKEADGEQLSARHLWLEQRFAESGFLMGDRGFNTAGKFLEALACKDELLIEGSVINAHQIANEILDARQLLAKHYKKRLADVHEQGTEHQLVADRAKLERLLRASFGG